jgi:hypothetical protein
MTHAKKAQTFGENVFKLVQHMIDKVKVNQTKPNKQNSDPDKCCNPLKLQLNLDQLKEEFMKDPSAILDETVDDPLVSYKKLVDELFYETIKPDASPKQDSVLYDQKKS